MSLVNKPGFLSVILFMTSVENEIIEINIGKFSPDFLNYLKQFHLDIFEKIKKTIPNILYLDNFTYSYEYRNFLRENKDNILNAFKLHVLDDSEKIEIYKNFFIFNKKRLIEQEKLTAKDKYARSYNIKR